MPVPKNTEIDIDISNPTYAYNAGSGSIAWDPKTGSLQIMDKGGVLIKLPETLQTGSKIKVKVEGAYSGTGSGFRYYLSNAGGSSTTY